MNERIHFDPAALNRQQADGLACVVCGYEFVGPAVPVGIVDGGQVFACTDHHDTRCSDCGTTRWTWTDTANDTARGLCEQNHPGPTYDRPARPSVPGEWPDGEPQTVRDAEGDRAELLPVAEGIAALLASIDPLADCARAIRADGDREAADAIDYAIGTLEYLRDAVDAGEVTDRALDVVRRANARARAVLAERTGR